MLPVEILGLDRCRAGEGIVIEFCGVSGTQPPNTLPSPSGAAGENSFPVMVPASNTGPFACMSPLILAFSRMLALPENAVAAVILYPLSTCTFAVAWRGVSRGIFLLALAAILHFAAPWQWIFVVMAGMSLLNAVGEGRWRWVSSSRACPEGSKG